MRSSGSRKGRRKAEDEGKGRSRSWRRGRNRLGWATGRKLAGVSNY